MTYYLTGLCITEWKTQATKLDWWFCVFLSKSVLEMKCKFGFIAQHDKNQKTISKTLANFSLFAK